MWPLRWSSGSFCFLPKACWLSNGPSQGLIRWSAVLHWHSCVAFGWLRRWGKDLGSVWVFRRHALNYFKLCCDLQDISLQGQHFALQVAAVRYGFCPFGWQHAACAAQLVVRETSLCGEEQALEEVCQSTEFGLYIFGEIGGKAVWFPVWVHPWK